MALITPLDVQRDIENERRRQIVEMGDAATGHPISSWLTLLGHHLRAANQHLYEPNGHRLAWKEILKLLALAVGAL